MSLVQPSAQRKMSSEVGPSVLRALSGWVLKTCNVGERPHNLSTQLVPHCSHDKEISWQLLVTDDWGVNRLALLDVILANIKNWSNKQRSELPSTVGIMKWWNTGSWVWNKAKKGTTFLDLKRAKSSLFRSLLAGIPWVTLQGRREVRENLLFSRIISSKLKNFPSQSLGNQAEVAGGQHG